MPEASFTFLIGGARSGKSSAAVRLASGYRGLVSFVVTAERLDDEMAARIERHREERPTEWVTIEEPIELASAVLSVPADSFVVVDCLSMWVANLVLASVVDVHEHANLVIETLRAHPSGCAVVSNEVGLGIVPDNALSREYRDILGRVNAAFARASSASYFFVAGQTIRLTPPPF